MGILSSEIRERWVGRDLRDQQMLHHQGRFTNIQSWSRGTPKRASSKGNLWPPRFHAHSQQQLLTARNSNEIWAMICPTISAKRDSVFHNRNRSPLSHSFLNSKYICPFLVCLNKSSPSKSSQHGSQILYDLCYYPVTNASPNLIILNVGSNTGMPFQDWNAIPRLEFQSKLQQSTFHLIFQIPVRFVL